MTTQLYVGNVNYRMTEDGLKQMFSEFGEVASAKIVIDRETGRSKGFGFVEMADADAADRAIESLNDQELDGRRIKVNIARPKKF
ncbi:MAG TPA: RNA-binding protein [bacterium]|nr:RNA-binding protein [bacterium]